MSLSFDQWLPGVTTYTITAAPTRLARVNANFTGTGALTVTKTGFPAYFSGAGNLTMIVS